MAIVTSPESERTIRVGLRCPCALAAFTIVAMTADGLQIARSDRLGMESSTVIKVLWGSVAWSVVVASVAVLGLACLTLTARAVASVSGRGGRCIGTVIAASPFSVALWIGTAALLSGPGAREQSWIGHARVAAMGASVTVPIVVVWIVLRAVTSSGTGLRGALLIATVLLVPAAIYADATVYPFLYPAFHLLLWLVVFSSTCVLATLSRPPIRRWASVVALVAVAAAAAYAWQRPFTNHMTARAVAYGDTLFLQKALTRLAPKPTAEFVEVSPALLTRLAAASSVDPRLLDAALPQRRSFNVLLLGIDALRADRLGHTGYRRDLTPHLDALLSRSVTFTTAWTAYPHTTYGMGAMLQGRYPSSTDVWAATPGTVLPAARRRHTLQGLLSKRGWRTETVTGMTPSFFRHGPTLQVDFDAFDRARRSGALALKSMDASRVTRFLFKALESVIPDRFFIWAHYFDPHAPYDPPSAEFGDSDQDRYDAEIAYVDRHVGILIERLVEYQLLDKTVIILFADHGESFGEHNRPPYHGTSLYEEQIHIPLAIHIPGLAPRVVESPVDTVDLKPTILDLLGINAPAGLHGHSLLPLILGMPETSHPPPYAFAELRNPRTFAVRDERFKLVLDADAQTYALFDLGSEQKELLDVSVTYPNELRRLKKILAAFRSLK